MRTTVGPLPSAVYWRRRAVVLGAALIAVLVLFWSCTGGDDDAKQRGGGAGNGTSTPAPATTTPSPAAPSFEDAPPPGGGPSLPSPNDATDPNADPDPNATGPAAGDPNAADPNATGAVVPGVGQSGAPNVNVTLPAGTQCTDAEVSVTPVPLRTAAKRGTAIEIKLKIKNISARTCTRDVGADLQEIYVKQGASVVWSSDKCGLTKGSELKQMPATLELEYGVTWNGRTSSKCSTGLAVGPVPNAGEYQVFGRLGGKVSAPARLSLTA